MILCEFYTVTISISTKPKLGIAATLYQFPYLMKRLLLPLLAIGMMAAVEARTWTSSDGKNHFAATYLSSDDDSVTVSMEGKPASFKLDLLSKEDRNWVKIEEKRLTDAESKATPKNATLADQYVGKKLMGKTSFINIDEFKALDTPKVPDYYIFYYSASW